jgi:mannose-6-phosphate isomerase-like protein (cupin superfamily)
MTSVLIKPGQAIHHIPSNALFSVMGTHFSIVPAMVGVIRIANDRPDNSWEVHEKGDELLMVLDGHFTMTTRDALGVTTDHDLGAGDILLIPAGEAHSAKLHSPYIDILFVTPETGTAVWQEATDKQISNPKSDPA